MQCFMNFVLENIFVWMGLCCFPRRQNNCYHLTKHTLRQQVSYKKKKEKKHTCMHIHAHMHPLAPYTFDAILYSWVYFPVIPRHGLHCYNWSYTWLVNTLPIFLEETLCQSPYPNHSLSLTCRMPGIKELVAPHYNCPRRWRPIDGLTVG